MYLCILIYLESINGRGGLLSTAYSAILAAQVPRCPSPGPEPT
jgi:hypothetical protein